MIGAANLLESRIRRFVRWIGAGVLVVALHIGAGSYAMLQWEEESDDETAGAIAVEVALEMTSDMTEPMNLAPGPLMEEAAPSQPSSEEVIEKVEEETPVEDLPSPAPEPEVVLQKQVPTEKEPEKEEEEKEPTPQVQSAEQSIAAPQTSAPPPIDAPVAKAAAAPQAGSTSADSRKVLSWQRSVVLHIGRHKRYPRAARSRGVEGEAIVRFVMDRSGQVASVELVRSSGSELLDAESLKLLNRAAPLPRPPPAVVGESLEFSVPVRFRLR